MALTVTTKLYYDGAENATWEADLVDVIVEEREGEVGYCEVHLSNKNNKYSVGGANEVSTDMKRLEVYVTMGVVRTWTRNGYWFRGYVYELDTTKPGVAIVRAGDAAWFLSRKRIYCWHRRFTNRSVFDILNDLAPTPVYRTIYPTNFPHVGYAASRRPVIAPQDSDALGRDMTAVEFSEGSSLLDVLEQLRQLVNAAMPLYLAATWELQGSLEPKNRYNAVTYATAALEWAAYAAEYKLVFCIGTGAPSNSYETMVKNGIKRTRDNYADRVVVTGREGEIGVAGVAEEESKLECIVSDNSLVDHGDCKRKAQQILSEVNAERYQGFVETALWAYWHEPGYWHGMVVKITDAQLSNVDLYLHVVGMKHELRRGVTTWYFSETFRDAVHALRRQKLNIENMVTQQDLDPLECTYPMQETMGETEQGFYAVLGDNIIAASNPGGAPGRLHVEWAQGSTQPSGDLADAVFDSYVVVYGVLAKVPTSQGGYCVEYHYTGDWDDADDANLSNIATTSTTITGLAASTVYFCRVFLRTTKGVFVPWSEEDSASSS